MRWWTNSPANMPDIRRFYFELQDDLLLVQNQLPSLATREQGESILQALGALADRLTSLLLTISPPPPASKTPLPTTGVQTTVLRVFLASPGDLMEERRRLRQVLLEFNQPGALADQHHVILQLHAWEDAVAGMGRAEDVILEQMPATSWGIFIGVLWGRFGSPTGARDPDTNLPYDGGTEEEFKLAYRAWKETGRPHILFYRRTDSPPSIEDIDPVQLSKVRAFFDQFKTAGAHQGLFTGYKTPGEFERRVRQDLTKLLPRLLPPRLHQPAPPGPEPAATHDDLEQPYLEWLVRVHGRLELRGIRVRGYSPAVALDRVYVALRGGQSSPDERADSRDLIDADLKDLEERMDWDAPEWGDRRLRRWKVLANSPTMPSLMERDRPSLFSDRQAEVLNLGEAFRRFRWLVILGDPGSGKTTLARWLTLHLAQTLRQGITRVQVAATQVNPDTADHSPPVDLGPARLPLLLRVSDYAEARQKHKRLESMWRIGEY